MITIRNNLLFISLFYGLLLAGYISAATSQQPLTASVNRTILNEGEALLLTVRSEGGNGLEPDFSPLKQNFRIQGRSSSQSYENINGKGRHIIEWQLALMPLETGRLIVPALKAGNYETHAINIEVLDSNTQLKEKNSNLPPVYIETEISQEKPFVQEEVLVTIKIFYSVPLSQNGNRLTPFEADNLIIKQLGDPRAYDTVVNGQRLGVYEIHYAIYPQTSGTITLPEQTFTGVMTVEGNPFGSGFFGMQTGRPVQAQAPPTTLVVQPIPDNWPGGSWLPARNISLTTQWGENIDHLKVGDAVTRTITLTAEGLTGDQLLPLHINDVEHIRRYPDKSVNNEQLTEQGLVGRRTESDALIPEQAGSLAIPPVKVRWFNTTTRQIEIAQSPGRTIEVAPSPIQHPIAPPPLQLSEANIITPETSSGTSPNTTSTSTKDIRLWQALTCLFALLWLITLGFLFLKLKQRRVIVSTTDADQNRADNVAGKASAQLSEKQVRKQLRASIKAAEPADIRYQMILWCQIRFGQSRLTTLEGCVHCPCGKPMKNAFHKLEEAIYNQAGHYDPSGLERAYDSWLNDLKNSSNNNAAKGISGSLYPAEKTGYP